MIHLSSFTTEYLNYCYPLAERTKFLYRQHLERLTLYLNDPPLDEITESKLVDFMANLRGTLGQPYSANYQSQIFRSVYSFFVFCHKHKHLPFNPMAGVPRPRPDNGAKPRLKIKQVKELLRVIKQNTTLNRRNLAIVLLMVDSGLRLNEVVSLQIHDFDPDTRSMWVTSAKTRKRREVPMRQETIGAIIDYLGERQAGPMFLDRYGDPITKEAVRQLMRRLRKRLKFPLYAHLLRHTFGNLYNKKGDVRKLQKIMGHSDVRTTSMYYTDPDFDDIQAEYEQVSPLAQIEQLSRKE
jgi:integrase